MTKRHLQYFSLLVLLLSAISVVGFTRFNFAAQETVRPDVVANDPAIKDLPNYRQWLRVNEKPLRSNNFVIDGLGG